MVYGHNARTKEELVQMIENGEWNKLLRRVGGGVMKSKNMIMVPLIEKVKEFVYPSLCDSIRIEEAALGQNAGLIGAGLLPLNQK